MARTRRSALIRASALLCLLWVGSDLGAHGFFESDYTPIGPSGSSSRLGLDDSGAAAPLASAHCFCHSTSIGAVMPVPPAGLTLVGTVAADVSLQVPPGAPHALDRPPQPAA
jgi:hypothetical protein